VCIVGARAPKLDAQIDALENCLVVDLVRLSDAPARRGREDYLGVAW
jgi:hypothetical protein